MQESKKIIPITPTTELYYRRAIKAFDQKNTNKAITYFQRGISLAITDQDYYYGTIQLALIYQHVGKFNESIDLLDAIINNPDTAFADLYYYQAVNLSYLNRLDEALEYLHDFLDILDDNTFMDSQYRQEAIDMCKAIEDKL